MINSLYLAAHRGPDTLIPCRDAGIESYHTDSDPIVADTDQ